MVLFLPVQRLGVTVVLALLWSPIGLAQSLPTAESIRPADSVRTASIDSVSLSFRDSLSADVSELKRLAVRADSLRAATVQGTDAADALRLMVLTLMLGAQEADWSAFAVETASVVGPDAGVGEVNTVHDCVIGRLFVVAVRLYTGPMAFKTAQDLCRAPDCDTASVRDLGERAAAAFERTRRHLAGASAHLMGLAAR